MNLNTLEDQDALQTRLYEATRLLATIGLHAVNTLARDAHSETERQFWAEKASKINVCLDDYYLLTDSELDTLLTDEPESVYNIRRSPETDKLFVADLPVHVTQQDGNISLEAIDVKDIGFHDRRPDTNLPDHIVTLTNELGASGLVPIVIDEDFDFSTLPDLRPAKQAQYFLIVIEGDIEPRVACTQQGSYEAVLELAKQYRGSNGDEDGLYCLEITQEGLPNMYPFSGADLS